MSSPKVVVTGAGGFLGRHVLRCLTNRTISVTALCGDASELAAVTAMSSQSAVGDILDESLIAPHIEGADAVIHLAGPPYVRESFDKPLDYARVHVLGTISVVQACRKYGVRRLVYVSSAEVYGTPAVSRVAETEPLRPRSPYGVAKVSAESFVQILLAGSSTSAVILRPFSVYGPGGASGALIPTIVRQALHDSKVELARLTPIRDFCHVDDIAAAVCLALDYSGEEAAAILNLGSGQGTSVYEMAELALQIVDRKLPIVQSATGDRPRDSDIDRLVADTTKATTLLGWRPQVTLRTGLERIISTFRESS